MHHWTAHNIAVRARLQLAHLLRLNPTAHDLWVRVILETLGEIDQELFCRS
jgi:hypothetical protein